MTIRQSVFLGGIFLLPMLIQHIHYLGESRPVFGLIQVFQRSPERKAKPATRGCGLPVMRECCVV
jgi:hypothetical protein